MFIKEFLKKYTYKKIKDKKSKLVNDIAKELKKLGSKDYYHLRIGLGIASENKEPQKMFDYYIKFNIDNFYIDYCYQIRGSLIIITRGDNEILSFVDQSIQYSTLEQPHDIQIKCSKKVLENLITDIKIKLTELRN